MTDARQFSEAYAQKLVAGPFPGRVDPWAEAPHYFQQIHADMIGHLVRQIQPALARLGYTLGREASLQIAAGREPDIFVQRAMNAPKSVQPWDYALAAAEILAEPGEIEPSGAPLQAIHVRESGGGRLVTVVDVVSPGNKTRPDEMADYRARRERLLLDQGVNIVEIDATRSMKRLFSAQAPQNHAYLTAIYLPGQSPRLVKIAYGTALKRVALPLRGEVLPMELQPAFDHSYGYNMIAAQLRDDQSYLAATLPFPSLLTDAEREAALAAVETWRVDLARLVSQ
jgi:hypothetical protein